MSKAVKQKLKCQPVYVPGSHARNKAKVKVKVKEVVKIEVFIAVDLCW
jgi:hypothetical protein